MTALATTTTLAEVAHLARRRAAMLDTPLSTDDLVQQLLARYDEVFGTDTRPVDLTGWIRRAMREIVDAELHRQVRDRRAGGRPADLESVLQGLATPVRAPALAKQRRLLLRRVSELIAGPECRVVLAMITERSLDRVADQLGLQPTDVALLHRRGLVQLQTWLDHDHELADRLRVASRQPRRPRTSV